MSGGGEKHLFALIMLNVLYATEHRNRIFPDAEDMFASLDEGRTGKIPYDKEAAKYAVTQRFWFEQAKRTQDILEELSKQYGVPVPDGCHSVLGYMDYVDYGHDQRRRNATWHVSCYSDDDRRRVKKVLKELHVKNFSLHKKVKEVLS